MSKPTNKSSQPDHLDSCRRHLAVLLPAAILSLTAALSPEDIEVLAYLISYHNINYPSTNPNSPHKKTNTDDVINADGDATSHLPASGCNCFRCYTSFWSRWDASPNRDLIHEIIEKYEEDGLTRKKSLTNKNKAKKRKKRSSKVSDDQSSIHETVRGGGEGGGAPVVGGGDGREGLPPEKEAPLRRVMGFIREKIWGSWNI